MRTDRWDAPFTADQQRALAEWQADPNTHSYTCPNDGKELVPQDTWVCPACDYVQRWAHPFLSADRDALDLAIDLINRRYADALKRLGEL